MLVYFILRGFSFNNKLLMNRIATFLRTPDFAVGPSPETFPSFEICIDVFIADIF